MRRSARHVLKAGEVALKGAYHLPVDPGAPARNQPGAPAASPSVRIAQSHAEFAILEVTCSCGTTTHVRCDYAAAEAVAASSDAAQP
jgi:hypothetical protein